GAQRRSRRQRPLGTIVDDLCVDVGQTPEHGQPRPLPVPVDRPANPEMPPLAGLVAILVLDHAPPFAAPPPAPAPATALPALPGFRRTRSPRYRIPLPLYGSGSRIARMLAAVWPTASLSLPLTTMRLGAGASS